MPDGISCSQCVLQWRYHGGNNWVRLSLFGIKIKQPLNKKHLKGSENGQSGLGIGPQEEFINCADISITGGGSIQTIATTKASTTSASTTSAILTTTIKTTIPTTAIITSKSTPISQTMTSIVKTSPTATSIQDLASTKKATFYFCDVYRGPPLTFPLPVDPYAYHGLILCRLIDPTSSITCKTCYEMCSTPLKVCPTSNCYCKWYPTQ